VFGKKLKEAKIIKITKVMKSQIKIINKKVIKKFKIQIKAVITFLKSRK